MTEQRIARLTQAHTLTPVAIQEHGLTRIGVAVPGLDGKTDLFLAKGGTQTREFTALTKLMQEFIPAILGVIDLNRLACEGASVARADMSAMLNVAAAESADLVLEAKGRLPSAHTVTRPLVATGDIRTTMHQIHHEKNDLSWQQNLRPSVEQAGGLEKIERRVGLSETDLAALRAVEVGGVQMHVDTTKDNLLVVQAYAQNVQPRLEAAGLSAEKVLQTIVQAESEHEPIREVLHRASGVPTRKQWSVR